MPRLIHDDMSSDTPMANATQSGTVQSTHSNTESLAGSPSAWAGHYDRIHPDLASEQQQSATLAIRRGTSVEAFGLSIAFNGKTDGIDGLGRSEAIVHSSATRSEAVQLFTRVDN
jgi:hypothetical protein